MKKIIISILLLMSIGFIVLGYQLHDHKSQDPIQKLEQLDMAYVYTETNNQQVSVHYGLFDFETNQYLQQETLNFPENSHSFIYDYPNHKLLYILSQAGLECCYLYDLDNQESIQLAQDINALRIQITQDEYVILGESYINLETSLYCINKETLNITPIDIPIHNDTTYPNTLSYIIQTDAILIQAVDTSIDSMNQEESSYLYYQYIYKDGVIQTLFNYSLANSTGIISNGQDVLLGIRTVDDDAMMYQYRLDSQKQSVQSISFNFQNVFYLSDDSRYLYILGPKIMQFDFQTSEVTPLDYDYDFHEHTQITLYNK